MGGKCRLLLRVDAFSQSKIQDLEYQLEEVDLFNKHPDKFQKLSEELVATQAALAVAEEDWLALAELV